MPPDTAVSGRRPGYAVGRMGGYAARFRPPAAAGRDPLGLALVVAVAVWTVVGVGAFFGLLSVPYSFTALVLVPVALGGLALFARGRRPVALRPAAAWAAFVLATLVGSVLVEASPVIVLVVPALVLSAMFCARRPAAAVVGTFVLTGAFNTIEVFTPIPVGETVDLALAGLWGAALWNFLLRRRERPLLVWPGMVASVLYLVVTAASILGAEGLFLGLYGYRVGAWYMAAFLLVAYAGWEAATYRRITLGLLVTALLVGGYGTLRWLIGPAQAELDQALAFNPAYNFVDGELRTFGSFPTGHHLAAWTSAVLPFCLAATLMYRGWLQLLGAAAVVVTGLAMLASEVRLAGAAAIAALVVVVALYQLSRGFKGLHLGSTAVAVLGLAAVGVVLFAVSAGSSADSADRYISALTSPTEDPSYKARVFKWETALADIEEHPLGQGLGTAGEARLKHGRFTNIGSHGVDNSYLLIALNQGFAVMGLFIAALVLLFLGLARRAVLATDREAAGLAIAACGTLVAFGVLFAGGNYVEGLTALAGWVVIGLGASTFTRRDPEAAP